eukprot:976252-Amphidinium_carterae.1
MCQQRTTAYAVSHYRATRFSAQLPKRHFFLCPLPLAATRRAPCALYAIDSCCSQGGSSCAVLVSLAMMAITYFPCAWASLTDQRDTLSNNWDQ